MFVVICTFISDKLLKIRSKTRSQSNVEAGLLQAQEPLRFPWIPERSGYLNDCCCDRLAVME